MIIGMDGAFVKGRPPTDRANLEIITGRIEADAEPSKVFAVVRDQDGHAKQHVQALLRQSGGDLETKLRVVFDGEDGMRSLVGKLFNANEFGQDDPTSAAANTDLDQSRTSSLLSGRRHVAAVRGIVPLSSTRWKIRHHVGGNVGPELPGCWAKHHRLCFQR